ncbi:hypothetical protein N9D83_04810, partial [Amylibacter sp.]|nr:hypothetical protein [Amylibacter sp.]
MDHFIYRNGILHAEDVAITEIAAAVGTPFYVYSQATLTRHFRVFDEALNGMNHLICYAMKANSNIAILKILGDLGAGMDVVSGGEYLRAKAAASMEAIDVVGIDVHIGSQLTDLEPFRLAYKKVAELTKVLRQDGHNIRRLD